MNIYTKSNHRRITKFGCIVGLLFLFTSSIAIGQEQQGGAQQGGAQQGGDSAGNGLPPGEQPPIGEPCRTGPYYVDRDRDGAGDENATATYFENCNTVPFPPDFVYGVPGGSPDSPGGDGIGTYAENNNDCNDYDEDIQTAILWYPDIDGDGDGDQNKAGVLSCLPIDEHSKNNNDCNDNEITITNKIYYRDIDGDGYGNYYDKITHCGNFPPSGYAIKSGDTNDNHYWIRTVPLKIDNQCPINEGRITVYLDEDKDGYGIGLGINSCEVPSGYARRIGDCNDKDPTVNFKIWYRDKDGDGFGDPNDQITSEETSSGVEGPGGPDDNPGDGTNGGCAPPSGYVENNLDNCIDEKGPNNGCIVGENPNEKLNSIRQLNFDITGKLVSASKSYFDELGKPTQSQSYDIKKGKIWAAQTLYDRQGRAALQTLSAPVRNHALFEFKNNFIQNSGNATFTTVDFENDPESPATVGTQPNTVGWYYSTNNTTEAYQDVTARPYSRTIYSELNPGAALKTIGGNKIDGKWKNGYIFSMPAGQELSKPDAFTESKYDTYKIIKTISRDVDSIENVVFTDTDGNTLAAARSGNDDMNTASRSSFVKIGAQGYVDVHIPKGLQGVTISQSQFLAPKQMEIYDLITEQKIDTSPGNLPFGFYRIAVTDINDFDAIAQDIKVTYPENYYDYSLNYYDKAGRLLRSKQPLQHLESTFDYNTLGQLEYTKSPDEGEAWFLYRKDGQIRFSINSKQWKNKEFSFTNYDDRGRPVESGVYTDEVLAYLNAHSLEGTNPFKDALKNVIDDKTHVLDISNRTEQQKTTYDRLSDNTFLSTLASTYHNPSFLASNVAKTENENTTTYYSYDIYGRVQWIVQKIEGLSEAKTIDYEYDPVTSQVNKVYYQKGAADQFTHRYTYDPVDYSLVKVETSIDDTNYTEHATYEYYETGALKRTNISQGLQGIDYVYNLQGALKSINHPSLASANDPGGDANDLFGMMIDYHEYDYNRPLTNIKSANYGANQYNGNIKGIRWNSNYNPVEGKEHTYSYTYNRNNWLKGAEYGHFTGDYNSVPVISEGEEGTAAQDHITTTDIINSGNSINYQANTSIIMQPGFHAKSGSTVTTQILGSGSIHNVNAGTFATNANGDYKVDNITYDANGNIKSLDRNKHTENGSGNVMDQLTYEYYDDPNPANPDEPFKPNQLRRVEDAAGDVSGAEDIGDQNGDNYVYNSIGQLIENTSENISYIYNASGLVTEVQKSNQLLVKFFYNDKGYRVRKEAYDSSDGSLSYTEHYVRDVAGTAMAIYRNGQVVENTIYGAGRLGVRKSDGVHLYQITDHLGNVRAVVGRNAQGQDMALTSATDYYPFGMPMPNRKITGEPYRYGYQGQELDSETGKEAFQLRLWDARIGRWLTTDPKGEFASPYLGMGNNPLRLTDPDGGSTQEPPVKGIAQFRDDTGQYFWNSELDTYEHYSPEDGSFIGYYSANEFALPVGDYSMSFSAIGVPNEEFNKNHAIDNLAVPLMSYLMARGEIKDLTNQDRYPGVKIYSSEHMNGAVTLGNIIFTNPGMEGGNALAHEYGHFLDFKHHFKYNQEDYINIIGVQSIISATKATLDSNINHHSSQSEIRADILGGAYRNINLYRPKQ